MGTLNRRKTKGPNCPARIIRNNKEFTNQSDIAEQFNQHFVNVGPNLAKAVPQSTDGDPCGLINHSPLPSFFFCFLSSIGRTELTSFLGGNLIKVGGIN